jgi:hypothetical protein
METRYGVKGTVFNDVFFTEDRISGVSTIKHIHEEISRQNSNLIELKETMSRSAQSLGANVIMNFRYGQKKHEWWELFAFKWDTESWHGEGDVIKM